MCYMVTATTQDMIKDVREEKRRRRRRQNRRVGVREMRQNLSVYLDRVKAGETLHVTEYGQVVALLAPLPAQRLTRLERLAREGRATAPARPLKPLTLPAPGRADAPRSEDVIAEMRDERL